MVKRKKRTKDIKAKSEKLGGGDKRKKPPKKRIVKQELTEQDIGFDSQSVDADNIRKVEEIEKQLKDSDASKFVLEFPRVKLLTTSSDKQYLYPLDFPSNKNVPFPTNSMIDSEGRKRQAEINEGKEKKDKITLKLAKEMVLDELIAEENRKLDEYNENNIIPFYQSERSRALVDLDLFSELEKVNIAYEKADSIKIPQKIVDMNLKRRTKLTKEEQEIKAKVIEFDKLLSSKASTTGNKLQTHVLDFNKDDQLLWLGIFDQEGSITPFEPIKTLWNSDLIFVDNDDIGNLIAFQLNMYNNKDPFEPNVYYQAEKWFAGEKAVSPDELKVAKALATSILNSVNSKMNTAIRGEIIDFIGAKSKPFRYINPQGDTDDITLSQQLVELTFRVYQGMRKPNLEVDIPEERNPIIFPEITLADFTPTTPKLFYKETETEDKGRLDTDMLIRASVKKFNIEPDSAQKMLETLHNQGWITYPRIKSTDLEQEDVEIRITDEKLEEWEQGKFVGTHIERNILQLVEDSKKARMSEPPKNFIRNGVWILQSGDQEFVSEPDILFAGDKDLYSHEEFDIRMGTKRGVLPENLTTFITTNKIGTPATRTHQLSRLKNAGIISLVNDRYNLDRRGLFIASAKQVYEESLGKDYFREQQKNIREATEVEDIEKIVNEFKILDKDFFSKWVGLLGTAMVEAERDLAFLEGF